MVIFRLKILISSEYLRGEPMIGVSKTSKTNILLFYTYRIFSRLYFHLAVLFVYFYINDIDFFYIELLLAIYGITLMISSQWKSKLFSHLSERTIISLGEIIKAVGLLCFTFEPHMAVLVIAQILSGVGYSLTAGTDSSLLKKMLPEEEKNSYKLIESSSNSYMFLSLLLAGIIGSILFKLNPHYVFYSSIGSNIICLISIWGLRLREKLYRINQKRKPMYKQASRKLISLINFGSITMQYHVLFH